MLILMKKLQMLLAVSLAALTACAGQTYRADVGAMFAITNGDIALQNAGGSLDLGSNQNDLDSEMGVGDTEVSPYVRLQMDDKKHRVRVHGFGLDAEGSGTLVGDYGGIVAGSQVRTSMEFFALGAAYGYEVLRDKNYRVALGGQLAFYKLDVGARANVGREQVQTDVIVPMPFAEVEGFLGPVTVGVNASFMSIDLGDASGIYWDTEAYARWQATKDFDVLCGYRYLLLDAYGTASSRDFDADLNVQGIFFSAGVKF